MSEKELEQRLEVKKHFEEISDFLKQNKNSFFTWNKLSEANKYTKFESMFILSCYVSEITSVDDFVIIFEVEAEEQQNYTKFLISNISENFAEKVTDNSVKNIFIHSICLKDDNFQFKDLSQLIPEPQLIKRFDYQLVIKKKEKPAEEPKPVIKREEPAPKKEQAKPAAKPKQKETKKDGKEKKSRKNSSSRTGSRKNSSSSSEGEEFFQGFKPKTKTESNTLKMKKDVIMEEDEENESKKKNTNPIKIDKKEYEKEENSFDSDHDEDKKEEKGPKKVLKKRKVKRTKTYVTEKGYMVTQDEYVDEEYWTDEDEEPVKKEPTKPIEPAHAPKAKKKKPQGQCGIESFFKK